MLRVPDARTGGGGESGSGKGYIAMSLWEKSNRCDPRARELADRHYNRQRVGHVNFVPPGRCLVLYGESKIGKAFWVTSWPYAEYVKHKWGGAFVCSAFRNEGYGIASELIIEAVKLTVDYFGQIPSLGMVTFIDRNKVEPINRRGFLHWGYTYEKAGFKYEGETGSGLKVMRLYAENFPL